MASKIILNRERLAYLRHIVHLDSDAEFAARIGVNRSQVSRILSGKSALGTKFIAGCLDLFTGKAFEELFDVVPDVPDDDGDGAAA